MNEELLKDIDLRRIATNGEAIYQARKTEYEPAHIGAFLAINIDSGDAYFAMSSAEAVVQARTSHPNRLFYVKKIGFDAAETLASLTKTH